MKTGAGDLCPTVVVIGGGYGGFAAAQALDEFADVVLVEPRDAFVHNVAALRALVEPGLAGVDLSAVRPAACQRTGCSGAGDRGRRRPGRAFLRGGAEARLCRPRDRLDLPVPSEIRYGRHRGRDQPLPAKPRRARPCRTSADRRCRADRARARRRDRRPLARQDGSRSSSPNPTSSPAPSSRSSATRCAASSPCAASSSSLGDPLTGSRRARRPRSGRLRSPRAPVARSRLRSGFAATGSGRSATT